MTRRFDAIVVGSGLGGLVAGGLYARSGRRVLVLEKNSDFGGSVGTYQRGQLTIEASLHEIDGLDEDDPKQRALRALGITDSVRFVEVGDLFEVRSPRLGKPFVMPAGLEAGLEAACERFPGHRRGLRSYFSVVAGLRRAISLAMRKEDERLWWVLNGPLLPVRFWPYLRHMHVPLADVLRARFGSDELVKLALCANLPYFGGDVDRLWFPFFAVAQGSFHIGGGHYPHGGSKVLTDHLVGLIRSLGGEAECGRRVTGIELADGRVAGVEHERAKGEDGRDRDVRREQAPVVFGNASPPVLGRMLPEPARAGFLAPYQGKPLSPSLWTIPLGFDRPPGELGVERYSTWVYPEWADSPRALQRGARALADPEGPLPPFIFVDYSRIDSGLPGPPYHGSMGGLDLIESWRGLDPDQYRDRRERWMERLVAALVREYPRLGPAIVQREMTTARSNETYLATPDGAVYGFAPEPPRSRFFYPRTKLEGLWLASAWTGLGGYTGAILGGEAAARAALGRAGRGGG